MFIIVPKTFCVKATTTEINQTMVTVCEGKPKTKSQPNYIFIIVPKKFIFAIIVFDQQKQIVYE